jgi:hypothetical protein
MKFALAAVAITLAAGASSRAHAQPRRSMHIGVSVGGYAATTGPARWGPSVFAELSPGGWLDHFGARIEARGFEGFGDGWLAAGVVYEAAAARPRLVLSLHGEAGWTYGEAICPVAGGGGHVALFVAGPLAVGVDATATLVYAGVDSTLALAASAVLRLGR